MPRGDETTLDVTSDRRVTVRLPEDFRMKDMRLWAKAEQEGDLEMCYRYLARLIVAWEGFGDLDPQDPASYDELHPKVYLELNRAVGRWLRSEIWGKN